ncbi:MAG: hypothetical protein BWX95_02480 [Bacteroidetes bacterium ADurb.Bin141]|nr:MAG: hypothetical protein BWX95_02480 [Bacteroidetes bacterium ADurb.Bin141]
MKKNLLFLVTTFFYFSVTTSAQYIPLITDSGTYYRTDYVVGHLGICVGLAASYQFQFVGDTIINAIAYKKVNKAGWVNGSLSQCYTGTPMGYQGALRDDSLQKKVFLIKPGNTSEDLVYDFNLNVGDTVKSILYDSLSGCPDIIIGYIDTVFINGTWHKRWNTTNMGCFAVGAMYVEGIGSLFGLLDYYIEFEGGPDLVCINHNGTIIYPNQGASCGLVGLTQSNEEKLCSISLSENQNEIQISLAGNSQSCSKVHFKIYDINGREIISDDLFDNYLLNKKKLSKGLLLLKFYNSNKVIQINKIINP